MGSFSIWHWAIVLGIAVLLFGGGGKLSRLMGDFGRGLREFKTSLDDSKRIAKGEGDEEKKKEGTSASRAKGKKAERT